MLAEQTKPPKKHSMKHKLTVRRRNCWLHQLYRDCISTIPNADDAYIANHELI